MGTTEIVVLVACVAIAVAGIVFGQRVTKKLEKADDVKKNNK